MRLLSLVLVLAACGNAGPVIDDLRMPETANVAADGYYAVDGLCSFHDDDGLVNKIRIFVPSVSQTYEFDAPGSLSHGTLPLVVKFSALSPKGAMAYEVALVNAAGTASPARAASVWLQ